MEACDVFNLSTSRLLDGMARLGGDALASALGGLSKYRRPCRAAAKLEDDG